MRKNLLLTTCLIYLFSYNVSAENITKSFLPINYHPKGMEVVAYSQKIQPILQSQEVQTWQKYYLLFLVALFTGIWVKFRKKITEVVKAILNQNISRQLYREHESSVHISSLFLLLNFVLATSLLVFHLLKKHMNSIDSYSFLAVTTGLALFFVLSREVSARLLSKVFMFSTEIKMYSFQLLNLYKLIGIMSVPISATLIIYSEISWIQYAAGVTLSILILYRFVILFLLGKDYLPRYSVYFFLYICTLEIMPPLLVVKFVQDTLR